MKMSSMLIDDIEFIRRQKHHRRRSKYSKLKILIMSKSNIENKIAKV